MDSKRIMARNIFARQFKLPRTTANILVERWTLEEVEAVLSKPIGELNALLAGITPAEFVPQSIQEEVAAKVQASVPTPSPEPVATPSVETPADQM